MAHYRAVVRMLPKTGVPEDAATNTWSFRADAIAILPDIEVELKQFYNSLSSLMSPLVAQNGVTITWYDLLDPEPRAPVRTHVWNFTADPGAGRNVLPVEVSSVMSFAGARVSGMPQARRRGRVFIGPLSTATIGTDGRFASAWYTPLRNSGAALLLASNNAATWEWVIFSRADDGFVSVTNGWVDNEPDTQRRRGRVATSRSVF